ncbi:MAG: MATE family efflux transporter [Lentisphaeria bacterium]|nr:MATE family efflux transporter [Lentisphaeria bacterium]
MSKSKKFQIDMCNGPLFSKIVRFSLPLMATNILQLFFHAADLIVLGRFAPGEAMAAVGATSSLAILGLNIFLGMATGVNVLMARYIGAKDAKRASRTVHTAVAVALYGGSAMALISLVLSKPMLRLMGTPENILDDASLYMWICSLGMPALIFYNFGSAILRAVGDTRRPMMYMAIAGGINVLLNLFFVLVCSMDVAGVALATKISNVVSAVLVARVLLNSTDSSRLVWKRVRLHWATLKEMLKIGLPAGLQGSFFSISNMTIQSSINSFGWQAIAGNTAAMSLEGIVYVGCSSYYYSAISFTGQNHGAGKLDRIIKSIFYCILCTVAAAGVLGGGCLFFGKELLHFYNPDGEVIEWGLLRMKILFSTYFLCGIMDVVSGSLRGLGHSIKPMLVIMLGVCGLRVFWVFCVFPFYRTMNNLMLSYPVSWCLVILINGLILYWVCRQMRQKSLQGGKLY